MSEQRPSTPPRTVSNPGSMRVITAQRAQPIEEEKRPFKQRVVTGAQDLALNAASIAKEAWADFRASDRFFKMKAGIVAGWAVLAALGLVIACPGSTIFANNDLHARLVLAGE